MSQAPGLSLADRFRGIKDPRMGRRVDHFLIDIMTIAIGGVICGAASWVAIEQFGQAKEPWVRTFLRLPNGSPSHDTFGRVFALLDPVQFEQSFSQWIETLPALTAGEGVAIEGKRLGHSYDSRLGKAAIHRVRAWASANRLVLAQLKTQAKSNEITAIPEVLKGLVIKGGIVTTHVMGCQTQIAQVTLEGEGDYVLALKGNQGTLPDNVQDLFADAAEINDREVAHDFEQTIDKDHGRLEIRRYWTISEPEFIAWLDPPGKWPG